MTKFQFVLFQLINALMCGLAGFNCLFGWNLIPVLWLAALSSGPGLRYIEEKFVNETN